MKIYDYIIYGGGPCGLFIATILSKKYKIALVEKNNKLGGCWAVHYYNNKYYSEHSPRVLNYDNISKAFLSYIGISDTDIIDIYKDSVLSLTFNIIKKFSVSDLLKLCCAYIINIYNPINISIKSWMTNNNISDAGKKQLYVLSILLADVPDKVLICDLLNSIATNRIVQFKNTEKWLSLIQNILNKNNCDIYLNTELISINNNSCILSSNNYHSLHTKKHVLCIDPYNLYKILKKSNLLNNWNFPTLKNSYYPSYGFQIHFYNKIIFPKEWLWSVETKFNIIALPISEYIENYTKDPNIKSVLSCTIIDQSILSYDNNVNIKNAVTQILNILKQNKQNNIGKYVVTINKLFINNMSNSIIKFNSELSGYVRMTDKIPFYGKLNNIALVGSYNDVGISTIGKSFKAGMNFINNESIEHDFIINDNTKLFFIYLIIILCFIVSKKLCNS